MQTIYLLTAATDHAVPMAGILDTVNSLSEDVKNTIQTLVTVVAVAFALVRMVMAKFALTAILISGLVAGLAIWIVYNVGWLQENIGDDINGEHSLSRLLADDHRHAA